MRLGLGESPQPVVGSRHPPVRQCRIGWTERATLPGLDNRKRFLIFPQRRVQAALRLENAPEVDVHLKRLAVRGLGVKVGFLGRLLNLSGNLRA